MLPYERIHDILNNLEYSTVKTNKGDVFINIESGFDIETSSTYINNEKCAFMYIWMFGLGIENPVLYGRTWDEFIELCEILSDFFKLSSNRRLIIYIHNLGYEFQFFHKYFNWLDVFAVKERKPLKAITDLGIEFRDSYILSGYSLANTAKNLTKYKVDKMVGDLDYTLIRHQETPLTDEEIMYCENDIKIILAYIKEQIEHEGNITLIPLTNTGRVRKYVRNRCYYKNSKGGKAGKGQYIRYRQIMEDLTLDVETYGQLKSAFMGGFTHANSLYSGALLKNVTSVDFTSSYPSVMISEKYPMSRFQKKQVTSLKMFYEYNAKYCTIFMARFKGLKCKIEQETYISESKCVSQINSLINNGRIVNAEEIVIHLTNVDMDIIDKVYKWDSLEITDFKYSKPAYLPKSIISSILKLYQDKTELKGVAGYEVEYLLSKGMLNSVYGMCVTDVVKDIDTYEVGTWGVDRVNVVEEIQKYNSSRNRFLFYAWGVWVTAYARRNLWTGIIALGNDYVYSDTDSIKLLNYEEHQAYFKWFNGLIVSKMVDMCKELKFNTKLLNPLTIEGEEKMLGVWDYEGTYPYFKTLGAKRYLVYTGKKFELTLAGLSKQNGVNYMVEQAGGDILKVFNLFNNDLHIPAERTGKNTHTYIDEEINLIVEDYLGVECEVHTKSGVHLEKCEFTLSIAKSYLEFLENLKNGYFYEGVTLQ